MQEQNFCVVFTQDLRMPHLHATQGETSKNINASARNLMLCVYSNPSNYNVTLQERLYKSRLQLHSTTLYGLPSYTLKVTKKNKNITTVTKKGSNSTRYMYGKMVCPFILSVSLQEMYRPVVFHRALKKKEKLTTTFLATSSS